MDYSTIPAVKEAVGRFQQMASDVHVIEPGSQEWFALPVEERRARADELRKYGFLSPKRDGVITETLEGMADSGLRVVEGLGSTLSEAGVTDALDEYASGVRARHRDIEAPEDYHALSWRPSDIGRTIGNAVGTTVPSMVVGGVTTMATGNPALGMAASTAAMFSHTWGDKVREYREAMPDMDEAGIKGLAAFEALGESLIENYGPWDVGRGIYGALAKRATRQAVEETTKRFGRQAVWNVLKKMGTSAMEEGTEEIAQSYWDALCRYLGGDRNVPWPTWDQIKEEFAGGAIGGMGLGAAGAAFEGGVNRLDRWAHETPAQDAPKKQPVKLDATSQEDKQKALGMVQTIAGMTGVKANVATPEQMDAKYQEIAQKLGISLDDAKKGELDGWRNPDNSDEVYINPNSKRGVLRAYGHEFKHWLDEKHPDLSGVFDEQALSMLNDRGKAELEKVKKDYGDGKLGDGQTEFLADTYGRLLADPNTLESFCKKLEGSKQGAGRQFVETVRQFVREVLDYLKANGQEGSKMFGTYSQLEEECADILNQVSELNHYGRNEDGSSRSFDAQPVNVSEVKTDPAFFQHRKGADAQTGVVPGHRMTGKYSPTTGGNLLFWEDKDGQKWLVNGHHRWQMITGQGVKRVNGIVLRESDGVTKADARKEGVKVNLREGTATPEDAAEFFRTHKMTREEALDESFLKEQDTSRNTANGYWIGTYAGDNLYANFRDGDISANKAAAIAEVAQGNLALEDAGLKMKNMPAAQMRSALSLLKQSLERQGENPEGKEQLLFDGLFNDDAIKLAERQSRVAATHIGDLRRKVKLAVAAEKLSRDKLNVKEVSKQLGVTVRSHADVKRQLESFQQELNRWEHYDTDAELIGQINDELDGVQPKPRPAEKPQPKREAPKTKPAPKAEQPKAKPPKAEQPPKAEAKPVELTEEQIRNSGLKQTTIDSALGYLKGNHNATNTIAYKQVRKALTDQSKVQPKEEPKTAPAPKSEQPKLEPKKIPATREGKEKRISDLLDKFGGKQGAGNAGGTKFSYHSADNTNADIDFEALSDEKAALYGEIIEATLDFGYDILKDRVFANRHDWREAMLDALGGHFARNGFSNANIKQIFDELWEKEYTTPEGARATLERFARGRRIGAQNTGLKADTIEQKMERIVESNARQKDGMLTKLAEEVGLEKKELEDYCESVLCDMVRRINEDANRSDAEKWEAVKELYDAQPILDTRTEESKRLQQFSTPITLAYMLQKWLRLDQGRTAYEPTAGTGMLVSLADESKTDVNELGAYRRTLLENGAFHNVWGNDATAFTPDGKYDAVIMNPPFGTVKNEQSVEGYRTSSLEMVIVGNALAAMKDDGRAAIIVGANTDEFGGKGHQTPKDRRLRTMLQNHYNLVGDYIVDGKLYSRQGASFPLRVFLVDGRKPASQIVEKYGSEQAMARFTTWDEIYEEIVRKDPHAELMPQPTPKPENKPKPETKPEAKPEPETKPEAEASPVPEPAKPEATAEEAEKDEYDDLKDIPEEHRVKPGEPINDLLNSYNPASRGHAIGTCVPKEQAAPLARALSRLNHAHDGDIDAYLVEELGYKDKEDLYGRLAAEQIDMVAQAIHNFQHGGADCGTIVGDQTGTGKGRVVASILRWAKRNGKVPVFFTNDAKLFSDMKARDGVAVGENFNPLLLGNEADSIVKDPLTGEVLQTPLSTNLKDKKNQSRALEEFIDGKSEFDCIFTSYSQFNNPFGGKSYQARIRGLEKLAASGKCVFVMDEAHKAGGSSNIGAFFVGGEIYKNKEKLSMPGILNYPGNKVFYSSATFAKTEDNMPLYFRGGFSSLMGEGRSNLSLTFGLLGPAGLQMLSRELVEGGHMRRLEQRWDGVEYKTVTPEGNTSTAVIQQWDRVAKVSQAFADLSHVISQALSVVKELEANKESKNLSGLTNQTFGSTSAQFMKSFILNMKLDFCIERTLAALKAGEKPVIAGDTTGESILRYLAETDGKKPGDNVNFSVQDILRKKLRDLLKIRGKSPTGENIETDVIEALSNCPEEEAKQFAMKIQLLVAQCDDIIAHCDMPSFKISPIDYLRQTLENYGYKVGEISGRELGIDYGTGKLKKLAAPDKKQLVTDFNRGDLDVLIVTRSGSTGISMHSAAEFQDRRKRAMLVLQAAEDINEYMQMLGRVFRVGQVELPRYELLNSGLAGETRYAIALARKMRSLNANTSGNQDSAVGGDLENMFNKYGDRVAVEAIMELPAKQRDFLMDLLPRLENQADGSIRPPKEYAKKLIGLALILENEHQNTLLNAFTSKYKELIDELNAQHKNELVIENHDDWQATTLSNVQIAEGDSHSPLLLEQPAYASNVQVDEHVRTKTAKDAVAMREKYKPDKALHDLRSEIEKGISRYENASGGLLPNEVYDRNKRIASLKNKLKILEQVCQTCFANAPVSVETYTGQGYNSTYGYYYAIRLQVPGAFQREINVEDAGNILSAVQVVFMDATGRMTAIPVARINNASDDVKANRRSYVTESVRHQMEEIFSGEELIEQNQYPMITGNLFNGIRKMLEMTGKDLKQKGFRGKVSGVNVTNSQASVGQLVRFTGEDGNPIVAFAMSKGTSDELRKKVEFSYYRPHEQVNPIREEGETQSWFEGMKDKFYRAKTRAQLKTQAATHIERFGGVRSILSAIIAGDYQFNSDIGHMVGQIILNTQEFRDLPLDKKTKVADAYIEAGKQAGRALAARRLMNIDIEDIESIQAAISAWVAKAQAKYPKLDVIKRLRDKVGIDPGMIPEEYAEDPEKLDRLLRDYTASIAPWEDKAYEWWVSSILSAPTTHVANTIGNVGNMLYELGVKRFVEASVNLLAKNPSGATFGEMRHMWSALNWKQAWQAAKVAFNREVLTENGKFNENDLRGPAIEGTKGRLIRMPGRYLRAADQLVKCLIRPVEATAMAYREAVSHGLSGKELNEYIQHQLEDENSTANEFGRERALDLTFNNDPGAAVNWMIHMRSQVPGMRYLFPFIRTPANLLRQGIRKGPLGALNLAWETVQLARGQRKADNEYIAHVAEQIICWGGIMLLCAGHGDDDEPWITGNNLATGGEGAFKRVHLPPLSVRIGGKWYSYRRIEPLATGLASFADGYNAYREAKDGRRMTAALRAMMTGAGKVITEKSYLDSIDQLVTLLNDPERKSEDWLANFGASWVPNAYRQTVNAFHDHAPDYKAGSKNWLLNTFQQTLSRAGLYRQVPKLDYFGRPVPKDLPDDQVGVGSVAWRLLMPVARRDAKGMDPVEQLMWNYNAEAETPYWPSLPSPYFQMDGKRYEVANYDAYAIRAGQLAHEEMLRQVKQGRLNVRHPGKYDIDLIRKIFSTARKHVKMELLQKKQVTRR